MTKLAYAIETIKLTTPDDQPWTVWDFSNDDNPPVIDQHIATILNAVVSGDLAEVEMSNSPDPYAEIARLTAERDNLLRGIHRQAMCIHICGAHIGPDTACTIEGLPKAVKHMVAENACLTAERDAAIKALNEAATMRGRAEGKLAAAELPGIVDGWKARAEKAEAERDQALARAAAAAVEMRERAADVSGHYMSDDADELLLDMWREDIRAIPIDPDAQKALNQMLAQAEQRGYANAMEAERKDADNLLAKAREDAIREAAAMCVPRKAKMKWGNRFTPSTKNPQSAAAQAARKQCHDAILALLNDGGGDEN